MNEIVDRFYQVHSIRQNVKSAHMSASNLHYEQVYPGAGEEVLQSEKRSCKTQLRPQENNNNKLYTDFPNWIINTDFSLLRITFILQLKQIHYSTINIVREINV